MTSLTTPATTLSRVDASRQNWIIKNVIGGQAKQTHFVEFTITVRVTRTKPSEEFLCEFQRTRRFNEFSSFRKALMNAYPSLQTTATFPQKTWTRGGSKNVQTIKQRIFWFKEWLKELLDSEQTKGVTNPAMISAMTAHWLYGDTETDVTLKKVESRASFNSVTDNVVTEPTIEDRKREREAKWMQLQTSKTKYHAEMDLAMDAHIIEANKRSDEFINVEKQNYERYAAILEKGWTVKKYSLNKTLMGNSKVQSRSMWITKDNGIKEMPEVVNGLLNGVQFQGNARSSGWSVKWCDPKQRTKAKGAIYTKMIITGVTRDTERGTNFVLVKTPDRMVEFEFATSIDVDSLLESWHYVCLLYNQMLSSVQSLFSFEEQGCRFIQSWKHVDTEILLVEDKWFLLNGIDTKGNINKARSESNIGIRNEQTTDTLVQQRSNYTNVKERWCGRMPLHERLVQRLHDIGNIGKIGTETLLRILDDKFMHRDARDDTEALAKRRLHFSKYALAYVHFATKFRTLLRDCVSGIGGVTSNIGNESERRRRRHWTDVSRCIMRSVVIDAGKQMKEKPRYLLDGHLSTLCLSFKWNKWFDAAFDVKFGIDEMEGVRLVEWWDSMIKGGNVGKNSKGKDDEVKGEVKETVENNNPSPKIDNFLKKKEEEFAVFTPKMEEDEVPVDLA